MSDTAKFIGLDYLTATTTDASIFDGVATEMVITAKDGDTDTDTAYDGCSVTITVQDSATIPNTLVTNHDTYELTSGVATISDFTVTIPPATTGPFNIYVQTVLTEDDIKEVSGRDYYPNGWVQKLYGIETLAFTADPDSVSRGANFTLSIEAQDSHGNKATDLTPTVTLTLNDADVDDILSETEVDIVAGAWTSSTMQIDGGTGAESGVAITATATGYVIATTAEFTIIELPSTLSITTSSLGSTEGDWVRSFAGNNGTYALTYYETWYGSAENGDAWFSGNWGQIAGSDGRRLKYVLGAWEADFWEYSFGGYGKSKTGHIIFRATTSEVDPRLATFIYNRFEKNVYAGATTYSGAGSTGVTDV